jgi:hypothetical protein
MNGVYEGGERKKDLQDDFKGRCDVFQIIPLNNMRMPLT